MKYYLNFRILKDKFMQYKFKIGRYNEMCYEIKENLKSHTMEVHEQNKQTLKSHIKEVHEGNKQTLKNHVTAVHEGNNQTLKSHIEVHEEKKHTLKRKYTKKQCW